MKELSGYFVPNFIVKRTTKNMLMISIVQFAIAFVILQYQGNSMIPKPLGVIQEAWEIFWSKGFTENFLSTLFFILKGMSISILISLFFSYLFKIDSLKGIGQIITKLRFLTYTGIIFVFTIMLHDSEKIKLWSLVAGIVPYFVTSLLAYFEDINPKEYELCYTLKMNQWKILYETVIRGKMHLVIEVLKQNFAIAWMMICGIEALCWSAGGLGTMIITENRHFRMEKVFGILLIILLTGIIFDYLFSLIKVYFFPYTDPNRYNKLWIVRLFSSNKR